MYSFILHSVVTFYAKQEIMQSSVNVTAAIAVAALSSEFVSERDADGEWIDAAIDRVSTDAAAMEAFAQKSSGFGGGKIVSFFTAWRHPLSFDILIRERGG